MGEIKSVKVDNWGVFFLQKLQNFFNKTDYCDLTLQFRDNSQLKVHRLVLSACTDYFNVLEQTCEVIDDALIMPMELQADVVVPIVNFMYTGTLEFELKMYGKLLRTAKEMNMTVLLKLLEAHRRTMEGVNRAQRPPSPKSIRRRATPIQNQQIVVPQQRRITTNTVSSTQQRRITQPRTIISSTPQVQITQYRQQSTSSIRTTSSTNTPTKIHVISHELQLKREPEEYETTTPSKSQQPPSPFEQLRKGFNNNKRLANVSFISPPAKKPNIEDVKEFAEQQRMRKQIAAEFAGDDEYEGMLDDDIHNDDDDDDIIMPIQNSNVVSRTQDIPPIISLKTDNGDKIPTILVRETPGSKLNTSKIVGEVIRQFPHLAKTNKSIKLKIISGNTGYQKVIVRKEQIGNGSDNEDSGQQVSQTGAVQVKLQKNTTKQSPNSILPLMKKEVADQTSTAAQTDVAISGTVQKRRIDSKTMHALLALGAENTTGPWLCLRCGVSGRPISIPSYRGFRKHLINTHKETIDPALCEHCGWRSSNDRELHFHIRVEHNINSTVFKFPECTRCSDIFLDADALKQHTIEIHEENKQQCIYCNKIFAKELQLYTHMKTYHKKQALEDGIIDYSDEELINTLTDGDRESSPNITEEKNSKVKIISDISLPSTGRLLKVESNAQPDSKVERKTTIRSKLIQLSDDGEKNDGHKFVGPDGSEVLLTREQRKELISQLNRENDSNQVLMVLNDSNADTNISEELETQIKGDDNSDQEDSNDQFDDNQIYADLKTQIDESANALLDDIKPMKNTSANLDESKESIEHLEWAENLISEHELADEAATVKKVAEKVKSDDDISKKLKELTGDWSEDENEESEVIKTTAVQEETGIELKKNKILAEQNQKKSTDSEEIIEKETEIINSKTTKSIDKVDEEKPEEEEEEVDDIELAMKNLHSEDVNEIDASRDEEMEKKVDIESDVKEIDSESVKQIDMPVKIEGDEEVDSIEKALRAVVETEVELDKSVEFQKVNDGEAEAKHDKAENVEVENEEADSPIESNVKLIDALLTKATSSSKKEENKITEDNLITSEVDENNSALEESGVKNVVEETTVTSSIVDDKIKDGKEKVAPDDKVKSLISEWGDEDEDKVNNA